MGEDCSDDSQPPDRRGLQFDSLNHAMSFPSIPDIFYLINFASFNRIIYTTFFIIAYISERCLFQVSTFHIILQHSVFLYPSSANSILQIAINQGWYTPLWTAKLSSFAIFLLALTAFGPSIMEFPSFILLSICLSIINIHTTK